VCHQPDALPPIYGEPLTDVSTEPLTLTAMDGARFAAYLARPQHPSGTGVLVLPDNRGLSGFYERLAVHLAEQGHAALALDYFGRTAGVDYRDRGPDFADLATLMPQHLGKLTRDGLYGDFDTGIAHLRGTGVADRVVSLGFCMGGRFAYLTSAPRFGLAGAIGLYGAPGPLRGAPGPTQLAAELAAPILALFGGADEGIPPSAVAELTAALAAAGVPHEVVTYPGAPHAFFEMEWREYADAQADAWQRILRFVGKPG
jgi:carboxymethylenebutenolidase